MKCTAAFVPHLGDPGKRILKPLFLLACLTLSQRSLGQTQGEPIVNSGTSFVPSPIFVDATQFPGLDMCVKIQNARASTSCAASGNGCRIFAPFVGTQQCSVDPFSAWGAGGELDLRGTQNLDIRTSATWHIPNGVHLIGLGISSPTTSGDYFNTMIRANNTQIFNTTNAAFAIPSEAIPNGTSVCPSDAICVVGTTATVTVNNTMCGTGSNNGSPNNGQDVFIYGGPGIFAAYHGLALLVSTCSGGTAASFQVQVPSGTNFCTSNCGTVYEGTPVIQMSDITLGNAQYRTQVEGIGIDCAFMPGCIPLVNTNAEEHSWFRNVNFYNTGGEYARISEAPTAAAGSGGSAGNGAANSGPYLTGEEIYSTKSVNCQVAAITATTFCLAMTSTKERASVVLPGTESQSTP
jgi:hypothetical protein